MNFKSSTAISYNFQLIKMFVTNNCGLVAFSVNILIYRMLETREVTLLLFSLKFTTEALVIVTLLQPTEIISLAFVRLLKERSSLSY